jgi:hypothetical protein
MTLRDQNKSRNSIFSPSTKRVLDGNTDGGIFNVKLNREYQQSEKILETTSSFRFDSPGNPIKSTQQLNVDFSEFSNHTFFNSARSKVHVAVDRILNYYPFDGTRVEVLEFLDKLSGFEKYVFDTFPKSTGSLWFSGSHLSVDPINNVTGKKISNDKLDTGLNPISFEFNIFVPSGSVNKNEVIIQRLQNSSVGYTVALSSSAASSSPNGIAPIHVHFTSGSAYTVLTSSINKGKFNHVAITMSRKTNDTSIYVDSILKDRSYAADLGPFNFNGKKLTIGHGTTHSYGSKSFVPIGKFSGSLDELRIFKEERSLSDIKKYKNKNIFKEDSLILYYRFNEPSGSFDPLSSNSSLVLDYSGNGLHSKVVNFDMSLRNIFKKSVGVITKTSIKGESLQNNPILFPGYKKVSNLVTELISSASSYDYNNPNLITKMIPKHYLSEAAAFESMVEDEGNIQENNTFEGDLPGKSKMPSSQVISSILYMWAEHFDEIKMLADEYGRFFNVNYDKHESVSDQFIPQLAKYYGFELPDIFRKASTSQKRYGENIKNNQKESVLSLQKIQNEIWRRILVDLPNLLQKKGTIAGIESIFRSMGINPSSPYKIREYGGTNVKKIKNTFEKKDKHHPMIRMSGSNKAGSVQLNGINTKVPLIKSNYLSSSRRSPGRPRQIGQFINGISNDPRDGLFTSGSWTYEATYKMIANSATAVTRSIARIQTTGSRVGSTTANNYLLYNVVASNEISYKNNPGSIRLYGRPMSGSASKVLSLQLKNVNMFDGNKWTISFGRFRSDHTGSVLSSSYFLRAGRVTNNGNLVYYSTSSFFNDSGATALNTINRQNNASGSMIVIGSMSLNYRPAAGLYHLNGYSVDSTYAVFSGSITQIKFFTKGLSNQETQTHVRNPFSVGVKDPLVNYSFTEAATGSFERLRLNTSIVQEVTESNSLGKITLNDFSQNGHVFTGTGFPANAAIIYPERFDYHILSPKFELATSNNKVRVKSFTRKENIEKYDSYRTPLYEFPLHETNTDDRRIGVEVSVIQALNEDIVNILSTLEYFDTSIGAPELVFSTEYRDLRNLRKVYFNRLKNKVNIKKFFEFFKWFDDTVGDIIEGVIPSTSRYVGTNFVIESHMLERPKMVYNYQDMYVGELDRLAVSTIFLNQFVGRVRKI